jgi:hypothetical protein
MLFKNGNSVNLKSYHAMPIPQKTLDYPSLPLEVVSQLQEKGERQSGSLPTGRQAKL